MTTYFTSDTHFGHAGMLSPRMGRPRPFSSREEHDEHLVAAWNNRVRPTDRVFHVGDFAYGCSRAYAEDVFRRLNGRKFLVVGNHEQRGLQMEWAAPPIQAGMIHVRDPGMPRAQRVWLSHYAHRTWEGARQGVIHLYGHSHGSLPGTALSCDVGVDACGYRPVTLPEIYEALAENRRLEEAAGVVAAMSEAA